jgi:hypothetical protein
MMVVCSPRVQRGPNATQKRKGKKMESFDEMATLEAWNCTEFSVYLGMVVLDQISVDK